MLGKVCLDLRNPNVGEGLSGKVEVTLNVLADDRFLVVTSNIMPFDPVSVEVVEHSHAGFRITILLKLFSVIRLSTRGVPSSGEGPIMEGSGRVCG